jgi:hypothetical protein
MWPDPITKAKWGSTQLSQSFMEVIFTADKFLQHVLKWEPDKTSFKKTVCSIPKKISIVPTGHTKL